MSQSNSALNVFIGIMATFISHAVVLTLLGILANLLDSSTLGGIAFFGIFGIGLAQLLYILPLIIWLRRKGRNDTMKGVIIGAVITLLLNGSCFVLFWSNI